MWCVSEECSRLKNIIIVKKKNVLSALKKLFIQWYLSMSELEYAEVMWFPHKKKYVLKSERIQRIAIQSARIRRSTI